MPGGVVEQFEHLLKPVKVMLDHQRDGSRNLERIPVTDCIDSKVLILQRRRATGHDSRNGYRCEFGHLPVETQGLRL